MTLVISWWVFPHKLRTGPCVTIVWRYYDTSISTSRRNGPERSGFPVTLGPDFGNSVFTRILSSSSRPRIFPKIDKKSSTKISQGCAPHPLLTGLRPTHPQRQMLNVWPQWCWIARPDRAPARVPELPITDCAGSSNNRLPRWPKLSAIQKISSQVLYSVSGLSFFALHIFSEIQREKIICHSCKCPEHHFVRKYYARFQNSLV